MEESGLLLESLDSLWFFSNVLSSTTQPPVRDVNNGNTTKEDSPKPTKPIVQTQQNASQNLEFVSPRCSKCRELALESTVEEAETKKEERRRRRKRKSKRKILGKLDFGFDGTSTDLGHFGVWEINTEITTACGYGMFRSKQHLVNMPPLSDGMAMKEHLKSWAYAVACTVR
ncbi:hypothetical protein JCGZ_21596 [Jatropha curcas]|uniref:Uncharacterized protein n=1 Tax=Jatropha curcas TaxID=180498 RepID=A0A067JMA1_JATCU|nr:hypothetical protein JCGZ_21596 [Jatropha curcas]